MKSIFSFAIAAILFVGLAVQPAMSQNRGGGAQKGNKGAVCTNFVDANGDGICDNVGTGVCKGGGTCTGTGTCTGKGKGMGKGTGTCDGTGQRLRLRDGSCGITPAPAVSEPKQSTRKSSSK